MTSSNWLSGFVLHRRPYRETSYLVDLFTLEQGKVGVVAKGVRNSRSERKSLLQPFQPLKVQLSGKSELKNLSQLDSDGRQIPLLGTQLFCGLYLNELLNRVMPAGLACETLFAFYAQTLNALVSATEVEISLREFEFALLEEMGVMADLSAEGDTGHPVVAEQFYQFTAQQGLILTPDGAGAGAIGGQALLDLYNGQWTSASKKAAKRINRIALHPLLGNKPLKSRDLFSASAVSRD